MPSLKEIKGRIASVQSTLKITSAMKLVASAKLRKSQQAIEGMRPYEQQLHGILSDLLSMEKADAGDYARQTEVKRVAVVAIASNSSLCGGFNINAVRTVEALLRDYPEAEVVVFSLGRKMAEAMKKAGYPSPVDLNVLVEHPAYGAVANLAGILIDGFLSGRYDRVELVYNHFVSTAKQVPTREVFLPVAPLAAAEPGTESATDFIVEPSVSEQLALLLPQTLKFKLYTALLDSVASEQAARTVAMQTATDNGNELLHGLTLQYNKSRQQKITSEILDLAGGALQ
ncbi:MAG: ATP synthase F1 subunit gamma [Bacteroidales bacterium]|nr:ATP synthase F1 subunit gamma [Bacteroidales bacterium]